MIVAVMVLDMTYQAVVIAEVLVPAVVFSLSRLLPLKTSLSTHFHLFGSPFEASAFIIRFHL